MQHLSSQAIQGEYTNEAMKRNLKRQIVIRVRTRTTLLAASGACKDVLPNSEKKASFLRFFITVRIQTIEIQKKTK